MRKSSRKFRRPERQSVIGRRVEQLESRCLLAAATLGLSFDGDNRQNITLRQIGGGLAAELLSPSLSFEYQGIPQGMFQGMPMAPRSESSGGAAPSDPPPSNAVPNSVPPSTAGAGGEGLGDNIDSFTPPIDSDKEMVPDAGGQIELGDYGDASDTTPADVRGERESRAVLEMLARLKYPVSTATASNADLTEPSSTTNSGDSGRFGSLRLDERTIDIAVSELADEFDAQPVQPRAVRQSLPAVDVRMDRSAGRFQAFEVLTIDPTAVRQESRGAHLVIPSTPAATTNDLGWSDESLGADEAEVNIVTLPVVQVRPTAEPGAAVEGTSPLALLYTFVDEKFSSSWNRAFALVTFGLLAYIFRVQHQSRSRVALDETVEEPEAKSPPRHSGWFARYFKFASRIRAAASS